MLTYSERGLVGQTVQVLGRRIVSGELLPGQVIDLDAVRVELDISRTVLREGLKVLSAKGLTDARPRRGTFVRERRAWALLDPDVLRWRFADPIDARLLRELAEVRSVLEPAGAALAALRRDAAAVERLDAALAAMGAARTPEEITSADIRFHRELLGAAGNELLSQVDVVVEAGLRARDLLVFGSPASGADPDVPAHRAVRDAVLAQDPEAARTLMQRLLDAAAEDVERLLGARTAGAAD